MLFHPKSLMLAFTAAAGLAAHDASAQYHPQRHPQKPTPVVVIVNAPVPQHRASEKTFIYPVYAPVLLEHKQKCHKPRPVNKYEKKHSHYKKHRDNARPRSHKMHGCH